MSLAEVVLLLTFSFFLVVTLRDNPAGGGEPLPVRVKRLEELLAKVQTELDETKKELEQTKVDLEREKRIRQWLEKMAGQPITPEILPSVIEGLIRGKPLCAQQKDQNLILDVALVDRELTVRVIELEPTLAAHLGSRGLGVSVGRVFHTKSELQPFLDEVLRYGPKCRFDYRLRYATGDDYHEARTYFERYLYPGGGLRRAR
jgi:hypothetical protein